MDVIIPIRFQVIYAESGNTHTLFFLIRKKGETKFGRFIKIAYLCRYDWQRSSYYPYYSLNIIRMTNRTFQHRVTIVGVAVPIIMAILAMYFLWHRTAVHLIIGFGMIVVIVMMLERLLHTCYLLEGDQLTIVRGRFVKKELVPLKDITRITKIRRRWLCLDYLLIAYGAGHETEVEPANEEAFLKEIKRRQDNNEDIQ